jgi:hypothetical protein
MSDGGLSLGTVGQQTGKYKMSIGKRPSLPFLNGSYYFFYKYYSFFRQRLKKSFFKSYHIHKAL